MIEFLKGKKTYVVALGAIVTAVGAYLSGALTLAQLVEAIFTAVGAMTIRAGIAKADK